MIFEVIQIYNTSTFNDTLYIKRENRKTNHMQNVTFLFFLNFFYLFHKFQETSFYIIMITWGSKLKHNEKTVIYSHTQSTSGSKKKKKTGNKRLSLQVNVIPRQKETLRSASTKLT